MLKCFVNSPRSPEGGQSKKGTIIISLNETVCFFYFLTFDLLY